MLKEWLASNPVGIEDGLRHDKWLAMMYPRLKLLHELLSDAGSFWMTLDDNESHRARLLLDEIFGANNCLGVMQWEKVYSSRMDAVGFSKDLDAVMVYAKDKPQVFMVAQYMQQNERQFTYVEPVTGKKARLRSLRKEGSNSLRTERPKTFYEITAPDGTPIYPIKPDGKEGTWRWEKPKLEAELKKDNPLVLIEKNEQGVWEVWVKQYFKGDSEKPISTLLRHADFGHTHGATEELKQIFGRKVFNTPKPTKLIKGILDIALPADGVVLDSFAGSGTTAHSVLALNEEDSGSRKFILVECEDYADSLTAERVRRAVNGYDHEGTQRKELHRERLNFSSLKKANKLLAHIQSIENLESHRFDAIKKEVKDGELVVTGEKNITARVEGLGGSFTYCTLGEAVEMDKLLTGEALPDFMALGSVLFHMATNEAFDPAVASEKDGHGYLGESSAFHVWLIYKPDLDFLKSREAAFTLSTAQALVTAKPGKRHLVFAPARFVSQKLLDEAKLPVEFGPLPFALYRVERG